MGISPAQLIIVLVIALILFGGAKKIPEFTLRFTERTRDFRNLLRSTKKNKSDNKNDN